MSVPPMLRVSGAVEAEEGVGADGGEAFLHFAILGSVGLDADVGIDGVLPGDEVGLFDCGRHGEDRDAGEILSC